VESGIENQAASIMLETHFIEIPEEVLGKATSELSLPGLENLKSNGRASSDHSLLTESEATAFLDSVRQKFGVDVLSSPRVQTGNGVQAVISITEQKTIGGEEHAVGPSLDIEPRIAADGSSVHLTVSARVKLLNDAQK
jgi:type II secretory pathway component GspD/PulD (secretin)